MKTATVTDLRDNFSQISSWIEHGEVVQIVRSGQPFARITAERHHTTLTAIPKVDFMAQLQEIWGDRIFSDNEIRQMREDEFLTFDANQKKLATAEGFDVPF